MKQLLILCLMLPFTVFALTEKEEKDFKKLIENKSSASKVGLFAANLGSMILSCPSGAVLTTLAGIVETFPVTPGILHTVAPSTGPQQGHRRKSISCYMSPIGGGAISFVSDLVAMMTDVSDGKIADRPEKWVKDGEMMVYDAEKYRESFEYARRAYSATGIAARNAFGKSGYCVDQYERLGIIIGAK